MDVENKEVVKRPLYGRRKIFTPTEEITAENIVAELTAALIPHRMNVLDEDYLYWYRRGIQPIKARTKEVRPEICNKIVVNNAEQVCVFKNGMFLQKPISYVSRREDAVITDKVRQLNEYLYNSGKRQADNAVVNNFHTMGLGVIYLEPSHSDNPNKPVKVYSLQPQSAFVVYSLRPGNKPKFAVNAVRTNDKYIYDVYTKDYVFRLSSGYVSQTIIDGYAFPHDTTTPTPIQLDSVEPNIIGAIPIIEYQYNENRMSAFEPAIDIMDAINLVESNRADGIEQAIQQLCVAYNCQFEEGTTANTIREAGMIVLKSNSENKADFKILESSFDQAQSQVAIDDLYEQMLYKCAMPSTTKGGTSTSDTGTAVYLRDGYQMAETAAANTTDLFEESNRLFDKVFLKILAIKNQFVLAPEDFEMRIERQSASNLISKTQAALNLKQLGLAPEIVFERSGISYDPLNDIEVSRKFIDQAWTTPSIQPSMNSSLTQDENPPKV